MTTNDYVTQKDQFLLTKQKTGFARIVLSYVILCVLDVNNISCLQLLEGTDKAFWNPQFWLYLNKIIRTLMICLLAMSLDWEIIPYMRSKCFIQRCKTVMLCNVSAFKFPTQFLRRNSRGNLSLHLNYYISWCYSVRSASIIRKRAFVYVVITKQTAHAHISPLRRKFTEQILYFGTYILSLM
jgi:hypothetical protein